jgi:hypothetical protein
MHIDITLLLNELLKVLVVGGAGMLIAILKKHLGIAGMEKIEKELKTKSAYATLAVQFVEQAYKDLHGKEKFEKAADWLSDQLGKVGLEVDEDDLKGLIESALKNAQAEFKKDWQDTLGK